MSRTAHDGDADRREHALPMTARLLLPPPALALIVLAVFLITADFGARRD